MVGDRLNTDIAFGKKGGLNTLLVLTGITTKVDVDAVSPQETPKYITQSLGDLRILMR